MKHNVEKLIKTSAFVYDNKNETEQEIAFLIKYQDYINWDKLCACIEVPWSDKLIDQFIDRFNWKQLTKTLLGFVGFRKSADFTNTAWLKKYESKIDWGNFSEYGWDISEEIILAFRHHWNWNKLIENDGVEWSCQLFTQIKTFLFHINAESINCSVMIKKITENRSIEFKEQLRREIDILFKYSDTNK
ncbi:hypothetical protein [Roseimarinus sediminis]|uniref:hypothetical protein n=1 Tax=Roseimarinus sediminis TaxID=1610899 RepID=UPI003D192C2E